MLTKAAYLEKRRAALRALDQEIIRLTDFADGVTEEAVMYHAAIDELLVARHKASEKIQQLRMAGDKAWVWEDEVTGVDEAWKELRRAVVNAISATYGEACRPVPSLYVASSHVRTGRIGCIAPRGARS